MVALRELEHLMPDILPLQTRVAEDLRRSALHNDAPGTHHISAVGAG
jgi:hypothetical protein